MPHPSQDLLFDSDLVCISGRFQVVDIRPFLNTHVLTGSVLIGGSESPVVTPHKQAYSLFINEIQ